MVDVLDVLSLNTNGMLSLAYKIIQVLWPTEGDQNDWMIAKQILIKRYNMAATKWTNQKQGDGNHLSL